MLNLSLSLTLRKKKRTTVVYGRWTVSTVNIAYKICGTK